MTVVEVSVSDGAELRSLREHLSRVPDVEVRQVSGLPEPNHLGVGDFLQIAAASGGALVVAIRTIPEFIRSRRTDVSVNVEIGADGGTEVLVTAANADDALRLLERALRG